MKPDPLPSTKNLILAAITWAMQELLLIAFLVYVFATLLIFSVSVLFNFKRAQIVASL